MGRAGIRDAYTTGRGSVIMRARAEVVTDGRDRETILVHEIPYQVNKAQLLERSGELVREKTIEGISDIRDESDRTGMRVVIEIKRDGSGRCGAEPAVSPHTPADQFPGQYAGHECRPSDADGSEGRDLGLL